MLLRPKGTVVCENRKEKEHRFSGREDWIMEVGKYTQRVLQRIQKIEPENATKIFGYLLLEHSLEEIMEYAVGTEEQIHSLIADAKSYLMSSPKLGSLNHLHPCLSYRHTAPRQCSSSTCIHVLASIHLAENQQHLFQKDHFHQRDVYGMEEQVHPPSPMGNDLPGNFYFPDVGLDLRSRSQLSCHYFYNGYCKHGQSCKFSHGHGNPDSFNQMIGIGLNEFPLEDRIISPRSLGKLELEIIELLKARRGFPISLASLPLLYQEMYGKALQAEGYLTESQRHGKVGFSLTKLLVQLRNIRLIDRPHGQHSVVLAEDALKYMDFRSDRNDPAASSSHQIYLTFPAESTFTDADVQNYFSQFGPVHDVRIPRQEKRMFGFVSFYHPQTVQQILAMGHPHYICGSRVLVKPYKEKSRLAERKYAERLDAQMYPPSLSFEMYNGLGQSACETAQSHSKHEIEDCDQALDPNGRRPLAMQLHQRLVPCQPCLGVESNFLEDQFSSLSITSRNSADDDKTWQPYNKFNDQNSLQVQLPESPFASPRFGSNSLYTVV